MRPNRDRSIVFALGLFACLPAIAEAGQERVGAGDFVHHELVPDHELALMRGGFVIPNGLLNFAISLAAQINGRPIYQGSLTFSPSTGLTNDIHHFDTSGFGVPVAGTVNLNDAIDQVVTSVKAGDGNVVPAEFGGTKGVVMTVQNTLSNVVIQQEMRLQLDLDANEFLQSPAAASMRGRFRQLRGFGPPH